MKLKALVIAGTVAGALAASAAPASAGIVVGYPPNPYHPPECCLVDQSAPVDVLISWQNAGPPNVIYPPNPF